MRLFITGTDTGAGKTYVTALLTRTLSARGQSVLPLKPVCCGDRQDAILLRDASGRPGLSLDEINPCWLNAPLAPLPASWEQNISLSLPPLVSHILARRSAADHLLVEGAGGWEVPLTPTETMASLAATLGFPVLLVVDNKLGALNHTLLTVRAIAAAGLPLAGLVLNHPRPGIDPASRSNRRVLESCFHLPILADLPHQADHLDLAPWKDLTHS